MTGSTAKEYTGTCGGIDGRRTELFLVDYKQPTAEKYYPKQNSQDDFEINLLNAAFQQSLLATSIEKEEAAGIQPAASVWSAQ